MITRSLSHRRLRLILPSGERRSPVAGPRHKGAFPTRGWARRSDSSFARAASYRGDQAERATASSNYWSSTTNANNPNNAWNVNFNNGNVNNDNKTNDKHVRAVRGGMWSAFTLCVEGGESVPNVGGRGLGRLAEHSTPGL